MLHITSLLLGIEVYSCNYFIDRPHYEHPIKKIAS